MNKLTVMFCALAGVASVASADVLVGFSSDDNPDSGGIPLIISADVTGTGVTGDLAFSFGTDGTVLNGGWDKNSAYDTSGDFGATGAGASTTSVKCWTTKSAGAYFDVTVTALSGYTVDLSTFHADIHVKYANTLEIFNIDLIGGDIGTGNITNNYTLATIGGNAPAGGDFGNQLDVDLSGFGYTLAPGESATFRYTTVGTGGSASPFWIDNIGISGAVTAIPEPATLGLVAAFSCAALFIRRRIMM